MPFLIRPIALFATLFSVCLGADFTPPECVGNITDFPNCEKADSIAIKCSNLSKQETIDCFCTQELLNAYVGCKGEFRQCVLGNSFDSASDDQISLWQDTCGPYLPDTITTPVAPTATRTLDADNCKAIAESCAQLSQSVTSCSSSYTKPVELMSCRCQESLVSLASACDIDGRQSCAGGTVTVTTENIWEFQNCQAAATIILQGSPSTWPITETTEAPTTTETATGTLSFGLDSTAATTTTSHGIRLMFSDVNWGAAAVVWVALWCWQIG